MVCTCNLSIQGEEEAERSEVQSYPWLHSNLEDSLSYMSALLRGGDDSDCTLSSQLYRQLHCGVIKSVTKTRWIFPKTSTNKFPLNPCEPTQVPLGQEAPGLLSLFKKWPFVTRNN